MSLPQDTPACITLGTFRDEPFQCIPLTRTVCETLIILRLQSCMCEDARGRVIDGGTGLQNLELVPADDIKVVPLVPLSLSTFGVTDSMDASRTKTEMIDIIRFEGVWCNQRHPRPSTRVARGSRAAKDDIGSGGSERITPQTICSINQKPYFC